MDYFDAPLTILLHSLNAPTDPSCVFYLAFSLFFLLFSIVISLLRWRLKPLSFISPLQHTMGFFSPHFSFSPSSRDRKCITSDVELTAKAVLGKTCLWVQFSNGFSHVFDSFIFVCYLKQFQSQSLSICVQAYIARVDAVHVTYLCRLVAEIWHEAEIIDSEVTGSLVS